MNIIKGETKKQVHTRFFRMMSMNRGLQLVREEGKIAQATNDSHMVTGCTTRKRPFLMTVAQTL